MDVWVTPPVQGTVFDAVTNAPIPKANVSVISDKAGVTATALTNSAGHFEAKPGTATEWRAIILFCPECENENLRSRLREPRNRLLYI
jgi:hypothetical protein